MSVDVFVRAFLATFFIVLTIVYTAKYVALRARDGAAPLHGGGDDAAAHIGRRCFQLARGAILLFCVVRVFEPGLDAYAAPLPMLSEPPISPLLGLLGALLMLMGLWSVLYVHTYMGALWRSGSPPDAVFERDGGALLQRGPFARSRNPMFLSVMLCQLGFFLAAPSVFTLLCLLTGCAILCVQSGVEERHLARRFGASYEAYRARTPRWL